MEGGSSVAGRHTQGEGFRKDCEKYNEATVLGWRVLRVTPAQMERWARAFDNWAVVDTLCFKLFDQTPHAWAMAETWCARNDEFVIL